MIKKNLSGPFQKSSHSLFQAITTNLIESENAMNILSIISLNANQNNSLIYTPATSTFKCFLKKSTLGKSLI